MLKYVNEDYAFRISLVNHERLMIGIACGVFQPQF